MSRSASTQSGYWVIAGLSLGPAVSNSFARFAYALVLPAMRAQLGWTYTQAGWMNTANAIGYLLGAVFTVRYVSRLGNRRLFGIGMVVTSLAIVGTGSTGQLDGLLALRFLSGFAGAMAFICGGVLASNAFPDRPAFAPTAIALYFGGAGVGILLSGAGVPLLLDARGDGAWPEAWLALGVLSLLFTAAALAAARRIGEPSSGADRSPWRAAPFGPAFASYFLFGSGYIAYMTFIIAWLRSHGAPTWEVIVTWGTLGVATLLAPLVWRRPLARWRAGEMFTATSVVIAIGAAIPLASTAPAAMILSAAFFGSAMFTVPAAVTTLVRNSLPKRAWGGAVAAFTMAFALGQAAGPVVTGWLADATGSLQSGLAASAAVLLLAGAVALRQRLIPQEAPVPT